MLDNPYAEATTDFAQFDKVELLQALETIPKFWFYFMLPEQITTEPPEFHIDGFNSMVSHAALRLAIAWPRGYSKTTIVKLAICHILTFSKSIQFIAYFSNTNTVAIDEMKDVAEMFESDNFKAVFGAVDWITRQETLGRWIFRIRGKLCIIRAFGAGQQVRGTNMHHLRPQMQIFDDAEDDENTATPTLARKFKKWVFGPAFKSGAKNCKRIWVGNLVGLHCLIHQFCESEFWSSIKYGCIKSDGTALWPEMYSLEYIKSEFLEYQSQNMVAQWFAEMMNMPVPDGMGLIGAEDIRYAPWAVAADSEFQFMTIDPAISKKTHADHSCLAVHGYVNKKWQILEVVKGKFDAIELFKAALVLSKKWRVRHIGIENTAYQASLQSVFRYLFLDHMEYGIEVLPLIAGQRKLERIMGWVGWLKNQNYVLTFGEQTVTQQLLAFDPTKDDNDDDVIDACAYGPQMITEHLNLIMHNQNSHVREQEAELEADVAGY